jgi:hypothetical protein
MEKLLLTEFGDGLADAGEGTADVIVGSGVAEADAVGGSEAVATHAGYMGNIEQVEGEVVGGTDDAVTIATAEQGAALREEVEGALRVVDFEAGDFFGEADDEVAAALECLAHLLDGLLGAGVGGFSGFL